MTPFPSPHETHGTEAQLLPFLRLLGKTALGMPFATLLPGQRQMMGGCLFPGCISLVYAVGGALRNEPRLFPDVPESGPACSPSRTPPSPGAACETSF